MFYTFIIATGLGIILLFVIYYFTGKLLKRQFLLQFGKHTVIEKHIGFATVEIRTGKILAANSVLLELLKCSFEEVENKTLMELFNFERSFFDEIIRNENERGKIVYFNIRGNQFIGRVQVLPKVSEEILLLSFVIEALNRNYQISPHNILEDLNDYAMDIIYRQDIAGRSWNFLSSAVEDITGRPASYFVSGGVDKFAELIHPDDLPKIANHFKEIYAATPTNFPDGIIDYRLRTPEGTYVHLHDRHTFVFDDNGKASHLIGVARDVTAQDQAVEKITTENSLVRQAFDNIGNACFILDADSLQVVDCNHSTVEVFGFTKDELIHKSLYTICSTENEYSYNKLREHITDEKIDKNIRFNWEFVTKSQTIFSAEISIFSIKSSNIKHYIFVIRNIQDFVELKYRFANLLNRNHSYIEFMPSAAFEVDAEGIVLELNKEAETLTGCPKSEIIGANVCNFIFDLKENGITIDQFGSIKKDNNAVIFDKARNKKHIVKLSINITNENTYLVFCSNITDTVLFEDTIHAIEDLYKSEQSTNIILSLIELLRVTLNADFLMLASADKIELTSNAKTMVVNNKGRILPNFEYSVKQDNTNEAAGFAPSDNLLNELRVTKFLCTRVTDSDNKNLAILTALFNNSIENERIAESLLKIFAMRISVEIEHEQNNAKIEKQTVNLENEVNQRTIQLKKINEELEKFAYIVSHDLKTHVRGIANLSSWLAIDYLHLLDDEGKNIVNLLVGRAELMNELIEAILQYSRLGRVTESMEVIELKELLVEVIQVLQVPEHIKVVLPNTMPTIYAERVRIMQLFQNLIGNAVKFNDKPEGLIEIKSAESLDYFLFTVSDNGPGIPIKYQEKAFEIFQKVHNDNNKSGTGIGLTVVKRIVELYEGTIRLESDGINGTAFIFSLNKNKVSLQQNNKQQPIE